MQGFIDGELGGFAWACGLFEGEGSIRRDRRNKNTEMELSSTDPDVVEKFHRIVGCGSVSPKVNNRGHLPQWRWRCGRWDKIGPLMERMKPYMGGRRRERIEEMLSDPPYACLQNVP